MLNVALMSMRGLSRDEEDKTLYTAVGFVTSIGGKNYGSWMIFRDAPTQLMMGSAARLMASNAIETQSLLKAKQHAKTDKGFAKKNMTDWFEEQFIPEKLSPVVYIEAFGEPTNAKFTGDIRPLWRFE